ncbi:N-arachidonyl glycine receptor-like [Littorina saxatilis]
MQHVNFSSLGTATPAVNFVTSQQSGNDSEMTGHMFDPDESPAYIIMRRLQTVLMPIICVLGIFGNILAAGTFLSPGLNKTSCCFHLASKSINDIGFLVSLFVVWLYRLRVPLFTTPGVCQVTVFLTYVCGCMSVWFVVSITAENFIRFTQPRLVQRYCNVVMAKRVVLGITVTTCLFYNFPLWTTGVMEDTNGRHCTALQQFQTIVMATTFIDTALTLIVPTIIMFFLIMAIVFKSMESFERKKRLRSTSSSSSTVSQGRKQKKRLTPEGKMTTFLFVISIIFLALNLPIHSIRLKMLIQVYVLGKGPPSYSDFILQRVFEILLYFNFSTNCLIYLLCGERFRAVFISKYLHRCFSPNSRRCKGKGGSGCTERSDGSPIMLTQRTTMVENEESVCVTCIPGDPNEAALLAFSSQNGGSC